MRRKDTRKASDERGLGSSDFVLDLLSEAEQRVKETLKMAGKVKTLAELTKEITDELGISEQD